MPALALALALTLTLTLILASARTLLTLPAKASWYCTCQVLGCLFMELGHKVQDFQFSRFLRGPKRMNNLVDWCEAPACN